MQIGDSYRISEICELEEDKSEEVKRKEEVSEEFFSIQLSTLTFCRKEQSGQIPFSSHPFQQSTIFFYLFMIWRVMASVFGKSDIECCV